MTPDELYCHDLMYETGVVTLSGSTFGQKEGTYHLRVTIVLDEKANEELLTKWEAFHKKWYNKYK
jgi:alanine transaminase